MAHCELCPKLDEEDDMMSPEGCNDLGETVASSTFTIKTLRFDRFGDVEEVPEPADLPDPKTLTRVGLKGFWKERKNNGQLFRWKLRDYFYDVKEAFRRAWVGYDACDIYDMGPVLCKKLRVQLIEFYKEHNEQINEPEVDAVVLEIIDLLAYEDETFVSEKLYPNMKGGKLCNNYSIEQWRAITELRKSKLERAFMLFGRYSMSLWI